MHDPGEHSSPVRLPFGSFPVINILLSHTDYLLQTNRAACTLFWLLSLWLANYANREKILNYRSEQDHQQNAIHVYTVFFQRTYFLPKFCRNRKNTYL